MSSSTPPLAGGCSPPSPSPASSPARCWQSRRSLWPPPVLILSMIAFAIDYALMAAAPSLWPGIRRPSHRRHRGRHLQTTASAANSAGGKAQRGVRGRRGVRRRLHGRDQTRCSACARRSPIARSAPLERGGDASSTGDAGEGRIAALPLVGRTHHRRLPPALPCRQCRAAANSPGSSGSSPALSIPSTWSFWAAIRRLGCGGDRLVMSAVLVQAHQPDQALRRATASRHDRSLFSYAFIQQGWQVYTFFVGAFRSLRLSGAQQRSPAWSARHQGRAGRISSGCRAILGPLIARRAGGGLASRLRRRRLPRRGHAIDGTGRADHRAVRAHAPGVTEPEPAPGDFRKLRMAFMPPLFWRSAQIGRLMRTEEVMLAGCLSDLIRGHAEAPNNRR